MNATNLDLLHVAAQRITNSVAAVLVNEGTDDAVTAVLTSLNADAAAIDAIHTAGPVVDPVAVAAAAAAAAAAAIASAQAAAQLAADQAAAAQRTAEAAAADAAALVADEAARAADAAAQLADTQLKADEAGTETAPVASPNPEITAVPATDTAVAGSATPTA